MIIGMTGLNPYSYFTGGNGQYYRVIPLRYYKIMFA